MSARIIVLSDYRRARVTVRMSGDLAAWFWAWACFWMGLQPRQRPVGEVREFRVRVA